MQFAELTVAELEKRIPGLISHGMLRVDIMQRSDGSLIVNEFESFEAAYQSSEIGTLLTRSFLTDFWYQILKRGLEKIYSELLIS
jgi:hypothetical protein